VAKFIREKVNSALKHGEAALALVAFLAVYREGAERRFSTRRFNEGPRRSSIGSASSPDSRCWRWFLLSSIATA